MSLGRTLDSLLPARPPAHYSWWSLQALLLAFVGVTAAVPALRLVNENRWLELDMNFAALRLGTNAYADAFFQRLWWAEALFVLTWIASRRRASLRIAFATAVVALATASVLHTVLMRFVVRQMSRAVADFESLVHGAPQVFDPRVGRLTQEVFAPLARDSLFSLLGWEGVASAIGWGALACVGFACGLFLTRGRAPGRVDASWGSRHRRRAVLLLLIPFIVRSTGSFGTRASAQSLPDVVLVSIDTLRADAVGAYGRAGSSTPAIDEMASEGVVFERAIAPSSWTLPSHASLFTGMLPVEHGCDLVQGLVLAPEIVTLAERLVEEGYRTTGVSASFFVSPIYGLDQGFERFTYLQTDAESVIDRALRELGASDDRPLFLFVHLFDPHDPYTPPADYRERFAKGIETDGHIDRAIADGTLSEQTRDELRRLYQTEVRYTDDQLSRLFGRLRERKRWAETIVVVTADHGESFGENGEIGHGTALYSQQIHVPLVIRDPARGTRGSRRPDVVDGLVRIMPTILEAIGLPASSPSLWEVVQRQPIYAETHLGLVPRLSVQLDRWKLIVPVVNGEPHRPDAELFDHEDDWDDARDLATLEAGVVDRLLDGPVSDYLGRQTTTSEPVSLTDTDIWILRSLGYLR